MPKYKYLGCGQTVTKTSKAGNQYLQRCVYAAPILADGSTASAINVYLTGDKVTVPDSANLSHGDMVFVDFNSKGFVEDFRALPSR